MAPTSPASRLVAAAARERLRPLGLRQQGRSRLWIDDHGWWLGVVEFRSPQWSQGSGLTVGVIWLWQDVDHMTFDVVERVAGSEEFRNEAQFTSVASDLALRAEVQVGKFRDQFTDLGAAARYLMAQPVRRGYLWDGFHAGVAAGLVGNVTTARERFAAVLAEDPIAPWIHDAQQTARLLSDLVDDARALREWVTNAVTSCRTKLGLEWQPADRIYWP